MGKIEGLHSVFHCTWDPGRIILGQTLLLHPYPDPCTTDSPPLQHGSGESPKFLAYFMGEEERGHQNQLESQRKPTN